MRRLILKKIYAEYPTLLGSVQSILRRPLDFQKGIFIIITNFLSGFINLLYTPSVIENISF